MVVRILPYTSVYCHSMLERPWHALAFEQYVTHNCSLSETLRCLHDAGFKMTRTPLRQFLLNRGVLRPNTHGGWMCVKRKPRQCEYCHNEYVPVSRTQRWCKTCCPTRKDAGRMSTYGLTISAFNEMMLRSNGRCEICGECFSDVPCIDHDHVTKRVRGLLCTQCNLRLGHVEVGPDWYVKAAAYLQRA